MTTRQRAEAETRTERRSTPAVQLVQTDIAHQTQKGLFDELPEGALTKHHHDLINARPGDRMHLCLALKVPATAREVAALMAYRGWSSWDARETLAEHLDIHPTQISRAWTQLQDAKVIRAAKKHHANGHVGIEHTFNGSAIIAVLANTRHPVLGDTVKSLREIHPTGPAQPAEAGGRRRKKARPKAAHEPAEQSELTPALPEPHAEAANDRLPPAHPDENTSDELAPANTPRDTSAGGKLPPAERAPEQAASGKLPLPEPKTAAGGKLPLAERAPEQAASGKLPLAEPETPAGGKLPLAERTPEQAAGGKLPPAERASEQAASGKLPLAEPETPAGGKLPLADKAPGQAADDKLPLAEGVSDSPTNGISEPLPDTSWPEEQAADDKLPPAAETAENREWQFAISASGNLPPEPEVTKPDDLIDININQSVTSGSKDQARMTNCHPRPENENETPSPEPNFAQTSNETQNTGQKHRPPSEDESSPPAWFRRLADKFDQDSTPDLRAIEEQAALAGWSVRTLDAATAIYIRAYRAKDVNDPTALFKKIAIQEAGKSRRARDSPSSGRLKYSEDYERRRR